MMNVLITGGAGWLGSRFVEVLSIGYGGKGKINSWGIKCLVHPNDDTRFLKKLQKKNKRLSVVYGDITKREDIAGLLAGINIVFHIAGLVHPRKIKELYEVNTEGTQNLLLEAERAGAKRFVYVSSNSVAGTNTKKHIPLTEETSPNPYMAYGKSKYMAENLVNNFNCINGMETVILRPCWFYGPNQPARQTTFFKMIARGNPLVFGDGSSIRSMSYVDNTVQAMLLAAEKKAAIGQTYWISDARPYTTREIYQTIGDILGVKKLRPRYLPNIVSSVFYLGDKVLQWLGLYIKEVHVAGEMNKDIFCSNEKAIKELGYNPRIALREGMERSIGWCKKKGLI
jgi:nucleoside-diphosphate-sugar epimerase